MKKLTRTVEEVYGYESIDGMFFDTQDNCQKYEKSYKMVILSAYKRRVVGQISEYALTECGSDDNIIDMVSIQNNDDLIAVNQYLVCAGSNFQLDGSTYGTTQMISHYYDAPFDWAYPMGTIEEYLEKIATRWKEKRGEFTKSSEK